MIKRFVFLCFLCLFFVGCGEKDLIDETIDTGNVTKFNLAKNYVLSYGKSIYNSYSSYKYNVLLDNEYSVSDGISVNIDGENVILDVTGFDDISCSSVMIINDSVKLDDCYIYGFTFMYEDGKAIEK